MAKKRVRKTPATESVTKKKKKVRNKVPPPAKKGVGRKKKKKKLTKAQAAEKWTDENRPASTSKFLMASIGRAQQEYGDNSILCAGDANKIVIGIPVPFPFEWLVENNIMPLSRMVQIDGKYGANKSTFLAEIIRWFRLVDGLGYIIENETKGAYDMALSVVGYPDENGGQECFGYLPSDSVEDWQRKLLWTCDDVRTFMTQKSEKNPYPCGRTFPVCIGLDSIMGKLSEETQASIESQGFASRAHPVEAMLITQFLKKFPQDMRLWPFTFVAINHVKKKHGVQTKPGQPTPRSKQGGDHIDYQETYEIELTKVKKESFLDDNAEGFEIRGNRLKLRCYKNSLGTDHHQVEVNLMWSNRRGPDDVPRQYSYFDWNSATVDLLLSFDGGRDKKIKSVIHLVKTKEGRYHCKRLGIAKSDALPKDEVGRMIQRNLTIRNELRDQLGIKRRKIFTPGIDYHTQVEVLKDLVEQRIDD